jgi:serine/threonine protein kinase
MNILEEDMYPLQGMKRKYSRGLRNITCMRIDGEIGSGTFGTVYKAIDNDSNSLVALKKIKMEKEKEGFPLTAIREIKILKALKHEHIIELKDVIIYNQDADKGYLLL